ncbi:MAG: 3-dehydroquinate synthase [Spirochaetaceae bacterium]|jgi:3-dehydroquinate synthase|nr:3-dehydroquinate synthase [Spirochaetaceae bacterium]
MNHDFTFGGHKSSAHIEAKTPRLGRIFSDMEAERAVIVCDRNTAPLAGEIAGGGAEIFALPDGEAAKNWQSVETVLRAVAGAGLGKDGLFVAVGGGVVSDICGFAASVYKRGAALAIVSTTLLGMADAALGGKTGFDLFDIKNFAGTFYPARHIYMPLDALRTLPPREWRSGLAEIIKTTVLDGSLYENETRKRLLALSPALSVAPDDACIDGAAALVGMAVRVKGDIVQKDPLETGDERALLNLGHTFGHALESAAGLGSLSHGEAVAWGMARAAELGVKLGITPQARAETIHDVLTELGYETRAPHPALADQEAFMWALADAKKKKAAGLRFVGPCGNGARVITPGLDGLKLAGEIAGLS